MNAKTMRTALLTLTTTVATFSASAKLVNYYEFNSAENLLKAEVGCGADGLAYDTDAKAPLEQAGIGALTAIDLADGEGTAHAVKIPTGASFGFAHGVTASAKDCYCIEMRVYVDTDSSFVSFLQLAQENDGDGYLFRKKSASNRVGGGTGGLDYVEGSELPLGEWHTYVVSVDGGIPSLYRDGKPIVAKLNFNWYLTDRPKFFMAADDDGEDGPICFDYVKVYDESRPAELELEPIVPAIPAGESYWVGASTANENWSNETNWYGNILPTTTNKVCFCKSLQNVCLDGDQTVKDFFANYGKSVRIYNDDPAKTNTLTISALEMLGQGDATVEFNGNVRVKYGTSGTRSNKAKIVVSGGAQFNANKLYYGDDGGQRLIVKDPKSYAEVAVSTATWGDRYNQTFEAYDYGTLKNTSSFKPAEAFTVIATNHAEVNAASLDLSASKAHKITCDDSYVVISKFSANANNASIQMDGEGYLKISSTFNMANGNYAQTLTLAGAGPEIESSHNGGTTLGHASYKDKLTIKLVPELTWSATDARVHKSSGGTSAKMTLADGVKFDINCQAFANYYGQKKMALLGQKYGSGASYTAPAASRVTYSGAGADKCSATFSTDATKFYVTLTSTNAPADKVAAVNAGSEASVFYATLEAAVEAAPDGADVVLTRDISVGKLAVTGKSIRIYALQPVTLTVIGKLGEGITIGDNVTLKEKAGMTMYLK